MVARLGVAMVARRGSATSGSEEGHQMGNGGKRGGLLRWHCACWECVHWSCCSAADSCTFVFSVTHAAVTC